MAQTIEDNNITTKHCPSEMNVADLGSRGASLNKIEKESCFNGPSWLLDESKWPNQPILNVSRRANSEIKPIKDIVAFTQEREQDEWDSLLERKNYWTTLRVTAWCLRFTKNCVNKRDKKELFKGPLTTTEIQDAKEHWIRKEQSHLPQNLERPGCKLEKDSKTGILKCIGRIQGYKPVYLENGLFTEKLIKHEHAKVKHFGVTNTMAAIRENWNMLHLGAHVKRCIRECNICKVFSTKPYKGNITAPLPEFRTQESRPFKYTGVDYAGPILYKKTKNEEAKSYVLIFTCAAIRAVHLELTKTQTAEEFQRKLNAFITRKTRPEVIISDNGGAFKSTSEWIKKIRKSEMLHDYVAKQEIKWKFNLSRSPWWGAIYERLLKDIKGVLYKTLGRTHLSFENLEAVVLDIEKHMNNRPLTYIETEVGEEQILTPNYIMWGQNAITIEDTEVEIEDVTKCQKRLESVRNHAWKRWSKEYINSLIDYHRVNRTEAKIPQIGEIVLLVGEEKNRGLWLKGRVIKLVKGRDNVVRGAIILHKKKRLERPLQLLCPLEIRSEEPMTESERKTEAMDNEVREMNSRKLRIAAKDSRMKTKLILDDD